MVGFLRVFSNINDYMILYMILYIYTEQCYLMKKMNNYFVLRSDYAIPVSINQDLVTDTKFVHI